jgi:hypothetical protein
VVWKELTPIMRLIKYRCTHNDPGLVCWGAEEYGRPALRAERARERVPAGGIVVLIVAHTFCAGGYGELLNERRNVLFSKSR